MFYSKWETEESIVGNLVKLDKKSASIPIIKNEKGTVAFGMRQPQCVNSNIRLHG